MKTSNNIPAYRFQGYTDAWELRKLGEVAEIIGGGTPSTSNSEFWDGDIDWYTPAEIGEQIYVDGSERKITQLGLDKSSATLLPANKTILFTSRAGIGKTAILHSDATTNQGFQSIVVDNNTEPYFIFSMTDKIKNKAISVASGSTFAEISSRALGQLEFMLPSINEQKAIGTFFSTLDRQITLHQRKLDTLKQQKKTYLKLLFPAKGQTKPALRFQGFEDDWKEVKVADIFQVTRGQVLSTNLVSDTKSDEYPYPVYSSQTKNNGLMGFYKDYLFDTAITWTTDGANAGTVRFREGKFYSTNVNGVLLSAEGYSNLAISEILDTVAWKYVSKVGNPKLMNNIMSEIILLIPGGFAEQEVLSSFFQTLDQELAQVEDKLASLKEMKKTLLRKLFV
ncbi:TPA: restriction endonuclease subunit S [Streptococcus suis]|nr:restriction endonuclease subunit S [Streptococcus suis]